MVSIEFRIIDKGVQRVHARDSKVNLAFGLDVVPAIW